MLMNSDFVLDHAKAMARRLRRKPRPARGSAKPDLPRMIDHAWTLAYQRRDHGRGAGRAARFVDGQLAATRPRRRPRGDQQLAVLANLCQQLLTPTSFLYVD